MNCWVTLVVNRIYACTFANEKFDDDSVAWDDRQMQRCVALLVGFVQQIGVGTDDLLDTG